MDSNNILFLGFADNKIPEFKEVKSKDWIMFGEDNKFPEQLLYLYNKSSNHNAIVNGKCIYVFGKGFPSGDKIVNQNGETFNDVIKKSCSDIELFGGCYVEVIWKIGGAAELRHIPFQTLRRAKENNGYWYCKNWAKYTTEKPVFIPDFNTDDKNGVQIFSYKEYRPGTDIYPLPGYFGALNDIETDVEISKYNLSIIKNGMFSSKMIVFNNGEPTSEIKRKIEADFKKKFTGAENGGNFMLVFNEDPAKAPVVNDLSTTDLDKLFDQLNKTTQAEIFSGHLVTSPMLFGIMEPGKLGGRNELQDAYEIFNNTYIGNKQKFLNSIAKILMPVVNISLSEIVPVNPINKIIFSAETISQNITQDEIREVLGYSPIEKPITIGAEQILKAINSLSPLVANKVLDSMKPEEIRALIGLQNPSGSTSVSDNTETLSTNENIKNLTGRQYQQMLRIVRQYSQGKINREQAAMLLKTSLAMSDEEINVMLGTDENFEATEDEAAEMFSQYGEPKKEYTVVKSFSFNSDSFLFADLSQIDSNIIDQIKKDKRADAATIAKAIDSNQEYINKRIAELVKSGVLKQSSKTIGIDKIIETVVVSDKIDYRPKPETVDVFVKYTYEKRPEAKGGEIIDTTRPFCRRLIELDRVYTRNEIETISQRLGYSVFDRAGGFWGKKGHCRHEWRKLIVIKKK